VWYVDNLKVSHMKKTVVTEILNTIKSKFGTLKVTTISKRHTYLGMDVTFKENGALQIRMKDYIKEAIKVSMDDVSKKISTPAQCMLFLRNWTQISQTYTII
jgi:hypothetical protein